MTSQTADIEALAQRLERVERQLRWWKRFGGAILTVLVAVMLLAATSAQAPDEIRAKRFVLEDAKGKERAKLYISNDFRDATFLTFIDNNGRERIRLGWYPLADMSRLSFDNEDGKENVALWTAAGGISMLNLEHGAASISLNVLPYPSFSQAQIDRPFLPFLLVSGDTGTASLGADPGHGAHLELKTPAKDAKLRASLDADADGLARLTLFDKDAKPRAGLIVLQDGRPTLTLTGQDAQPRAIMDASSNLKLYDENAKLRAVLGSTELETISTGETSRRAESSLVLFDKDGKVLWHAP